MLIAPRIPELARRDRFIRRAVAQRVVHAVLEGDAVARVASRCSESAAGVALLWSARREAERWSGVLAQRPRVTDLGLGELIEHVLPALAAEGVAVGPDWSSDTIEPEIGAHDLDGRLRLEMLDLFVLGFQQTGRVWILEGPDGPASMPGRADGTVSLACWSSAELAQACVAGAWSGMRVLEIPRDGFRDMTVPWLDSRGWTIAADPASTLAAAEIAPRPLLARLAQPSRPHHV